MSPPPPQPGSAQTGIRIGELSRRTGLSPDVLRAWERRYDLLSPSRTSGGFRIYSAADEARVAEMQRLLAAGYPASAAARLTLARDAERADGGDDGWIAALERALDGFDDRRADALLDRALADATIESVVRDLLAYLRRLGDRWAAGEATVAQEHYATTLVRGRLLALARGWGGAVGPRALLACPGGEHHDIGLVAFGLCLRQRGWSITYLGQDTPPEYIAEAAEALDPAVIVVSAVHPEPLAAARSGLEALAARWRLVLCGAGVDPAFAASIGADVETSDPVDAAARLADEVGARTG